MWNDTDNDGIRDAAEELFAARADKTIKGYGFAYNGHNTLPITANHYIDNIIAVSGGSAQSPTTTTVARAGDAVGAGITLSWTFNDGYAGAADIWTVSGAADSATDIFTTSPTAWTREFSGVTSPYTDTSTAARVGSNTQKFYKVVRAGTVSLTADMLRVDVAGKFDLNARLGYYSLVSLPIVPAGTDVNTVIGGQMNQEPLEFSADQIFVPRADGGNDTCWLKNDGRWYASGSDTVLASVNVDTSKGFYIQNSSMPAHTQKYVTIVGTIETAAARTLNDVPQLYNTIGTPFPSAVPMNSTGLYESGLKAGAFEFAASQIYEPDYSTLEGGFRIAWLKNDGRWYDSGSDTAETAIRLRPGVGYYLYNTEIENPATNFDWAYPRPY
jgi:hypothetical protein